MVIPYEFKVDFEVGRAPRAPGQERRALEEAELVKKTFNRKYRTWALRFKVSSANATRAIGLRVQRHEATASLPVARFSYAPDEAIVCRCERVTFGEIVRFIRENEVRDVNQLKAIRAGMGACGSKTCAPLYAAVFRAAGVDPGGVAEGQAEASVGGGPTRDAGRRRPWREGGVEGRSLSMSAYDVVIVGAGSVGLPLSPTTAPSGASRSSSWTREPPGAEGRTVPR